MELIDPTQFHRPVLPMQPAQQNTTGADGVSQAHIGTFGFNPAHTEKWHQLQGVGSLLPERPVQFGSV